MTTSTTALLWLAPIAYLAAGLLALVVGYRRGWWLAEAVAVGVLAATLIVAAEAVYRVANNDTADGVGLIMTVLITGLGWVIVRFSRRYLTGEPNQGRYIVTLMSTLAAVTIVTLSQHLGLLVAAWIASSLALHGLLTYYSDRPAALASAHKKFLASRLAELCLIGAVGLAYWEAGSLELSWLAAYGANGETLPPMLHAAMVLLALAAVFKSAQLPVHGWILQVMEAPTPVSALLHAGVVNLSGFVLIRLAEPLAAAPIAQALLVIVGSLTAVLAALVMMTRVSIKVRLAWSTCSQMGFMLLECGLGLYELALLHLIAHSAYKAHAFLASGDTVLVTRQHALLPTPQRSSAPYRQFAGHLLAAPVAIGFLLAASMGWQLIAPSLALPTVAVVIVGLGLAPLLWPEADQPLRALRRGALAILVLAHLYLLWHIAFAALAPMPDKVVSPLLIGWALAMFLALYTVQTLIMLAPESPACRVLRRWAVAGFFMDEVFTRITFRVWPLRMPQEAREAPPTAPSVLPGEPS